MPWQVVCPEYPSVQSSGPCIDLPGMYHYISQENSKRELLLFLSVLSFSKAHLLHFPPIVSNIRSKYKILILNTPGSPQNGLNTHFEDIILLAALSVTKFPKCSGPCIVVTYLVSLYFLGKQQNRASPILVSLVVFQSSSPAFPTHCVTLAKCKVGNNGVFKSCTFTVVESLQFIHLVT